MLILQRTDNDNNYFCKEEMAPLTSIEYKTFLIKQTDIFTKVSFEEKYTSGKNYLKVRDHFHHTGKHKGAAHGIYDLKYNIPKKIIVVFHNGSNYDC